MRFAAEFSIFIALDFFFFQVETHILGQKLSY